jgi:hypothetical protein
MHNRETIDTTGPDAVQVDFDWHRQLDKTVLFDVLVQRLSRTSQYEALVNPARLDKREALRLRGFLARQQTHQTTLMERVRTIAWITGLALSQQRPEWTKELCDAEVRRLLLCRDSRPKEDAIGEQNPEAPQAPCSDIMPKEDNTAVAQLDDNSQGEPRLSARESYFEWQGQNFLLENNLVPFFELTKQWPHYAEIQQGWWNLLPVLDLGLPRLSTDLEPQLAEGFFLELRHGDRSRAFSEYAALIRHHADDEIFWHLVTRALNARSSKAASVEALPLPYYLACGWIHRFLCWLTNPDRETVLFRCLGVCGLTPEAIKKAVQRTGFVDWTNFPDAYPVAPLKVKLESKTIDGGGTQKVCHFLINRGGQT